MRVPCAMISKADAQALVDEFGRRTPNNAPKAQLALARPYSDVAAMTPALEAEAKLREALFDLLALLEERMLETGDEASSDDDANAPLRRSVALASLELGAFLARASWEDDALRCVVAAGMVSRRPTCTRGRLCGTSATT